MLCTCLLAGGPSLRLSKILFPLLVGLSHQMSPFWGDHSPKKLDLCFSRGECVIDMESLFCSPIFLWSEATFFHSGATVQMLSLLVVPPLLISSTAFTLRVKISSFLLAPQPPGLLISRGVAQAPRGSVGTICSLECNPPGSPLFMSRDP